jgi:hypothetical protein
MRPQNPEVRLPTAADSQKPSLHITATVVIVIPVLARYSPFGIKKYIIYLRDLSYAPVKWPSCQF